jgi:integrase
MSGPTIRRWWYRHAQAAGLVEPGTTSGVNMHRARHTFATELRRVVVLGAASQALGHSDLSTTASINGHYDLSDLERATEAFAKSLREREEPTD